MVVSPLTLRIPATLSARDLSVLAAQAGEGAAVALDFTDFSYASPTVEPLAAQMVLGLTRRQRVAIAGLPNWTAQPPSAWPQGSAVVLAALAAQATVDRVGAANVRGQIGADLSAGEIVTGVASVRFSTYSSLRQRGWKSLDRWGSGPGLRLALSRHLVQPSLLASEHVGDLAVLIAEAVQNVVKWATRESGGEPIAGRMMVSLARSSVRELALLYGDRSGSLEEYLNWYSAQGGALDDPVALVSVVDVGDGVAATFEGHDVGHLPTLLERNIVSKAMLPGSATGRRHGAPQTGLGFRNMLASVVACRGAMQLRTGRQLGLFFDRAGSQSAEASLFSDNWVFEEGHAFAYGTTLSAVVPFGRPAELFP